MWLYSIIQVFEHLIKKSVVFSVYITGRDNNGTTIDVNQSLNQIGYSFVTWKTICLVVVSVVVILVFIILFAYSVAATVYIFFGTAFVSLALAFLVTANYGYTTLLEGNKGLDTSLMWFLGSTRIAVQFIDMVFFCRNIKAAIGSIKAASKTSWLSTVLFSLGVVFLQFLVIVFCGMAALFLASAGKTYLSGLAVFVMLWITFFVSVFRSMMLTYKTQPKNAAFTFGTVFLFTVWNDFITVAGGELAATVIFVLITLWQIFDRVILKGIGFFILFGLYTLWSAMRLCLGKCGKTIDAYLQMFEFENVYIVRAISGKSFIASAKYACKLLRENSLQDTDILFRLLKVTPMCAVALLGFALFSSWQQIVPTIFAALSTYLITATFLHSFEVVVKTAEFCKLIGREDNDNLEQSTSEEVY